MENTLNVEKIKTNNFLIKTTNNRKVKNNHYRGQLKRVNSFIKIGLLLA